MFSDCCAVGASQLPLARRPGPGARGRERPPHQSQNAQHLRLPSHSLRTSGFGRHGPALWRRQRPQTQGLHPPMNDWQAAVARLPTLPPQLFSGINKQNLKAEYDNKWVPVVWYSNISLILFTVFSEHYGDRSLSLHLFLSQEKKKDKCKKKKKSIKQHITKNDFCSRLNNVHGGLVVFHMSRVHL